MGNGRKSRQNRKKDPAGNRTLRLHKMQKNLPHHPKQRKSKPPQTIRTAPFFLLFSRPIMRFVPVVPTILLAHGPSYAFLIHKPYIVRLLIGKGVLLMRRSKLEMYVAILKVLSQRGPLKLTHVMYKANVNCDNSRNT